MFLPSRGLVDVRLVTFRDGAVSQVALVCQSVQCRTRPTVADAASNVVILSLAIFGGVPIARTRHEEAPDEIDEAQVHLVARWKRMRR
jgi:hypothetical protein